MSSILPIGMKRRLWMPFFVVPTGFKARSGIAAR
jgi:hypothetical protein